MYNEDEGECEVLSSEGGNNNERRRSDYEQVPSESLSRVAQQKQHHRGMTTTENNTHHPTNTSIISPSDLQIFQSIMSSTNHHQHHHQQQSDGVLNTLPRILNPPPRREERSRHSTDNDEGLIFSLRDELREKKRDAPLMTEVYCSKKRTLSPSFLASSSSHGFKKLRAGCCIASGSAEGRGILSLRECCRQLSSEVTPENYTEKQQQQMMVHNNSNNNEGGCHSSEPATQTKVSADDDGQTSSVRSLTSHQVDDWQEHEINDDCSKAVQDDKFTTMDNVGDGEEEEHDSMTNNHENNRMYLPFRHDVMQLQLYDATTTTTGRIIDNNDNEQHVQNCINDSHQGLGGCKENLAMNAACDNVVENNILHHDLVHNELISKGNGNEFAAAVCKPSSQEPINNDLLSSTSVNKQGSDSTTSSILIKSHPNTPRRRNTLTVGQLKIALLFEASIVHHHHQEGSGNDAKCIFDKYWKTVGEYLCSSSRRSDETSSSSSSAAAVGFEAILHDFLKTRRMKRLHNKLILAIMASIVKEKSGILESSIDQSNDMLSDVVAVDRSDEETEIEQWNSEFGLQSVGDEHLFTNTEITNNIDTNLIRSIRSDAPAEDDYDCIPSARLPGVLQIEPSIRRLVSHVGITASENAMWMVIVAVREYISGLIKRVISNDNDFDDGCAPSVPNHFQISIACPRIVPEQKENLNNRADDSNFIERKIINSICLSHILAENPSTASRLTSMYCVSVDGWRGCVSHPSLDKVNLFINSSIERNVSRRELLAEKSKQLTVVPNVGPRPQSDKSSVATKKSPPPSDTSIFKPLSAHPSDKNFSSSKKTADISSRTQSFPSTSALKSISDSKTQIPDGTLSQAQLQASQFPAQRMDQLKLLQSKFLQSQLTTPFMPAPNPQSVYGIQTMNNYNTTQIDMQPSCAMNLSNPIPVQQFVMKPVLPEKSTQKKSILPSIVFTKSRDEEPQILSRIHELFNPWNRRLSGGGTESFAMLAKPSTKESIATSGENNRTDEASMSKISDLGQSAHSESEKDTTSLNDDAKSTATIKSTTTVASRGRGFGAKNLAAMKARMSVASRSAKTSSSDLERKKV